MTFWRVVIATPTMPFPPCRTEQEQQVQILVDTALSHGAAVTIVAPCTQTVAELAGHLLVRSKFLLRPVIPTQDPRHREVITNWIEPPASGPSRFFLEHPWFTLLDRDQLPTTSADINLATVWALWTSAFISLLSQLNEEVTVLHAFGWQTALVPAMLRYISGYASSSISVFSPGKHLPSDSLKPGVRALLRLPQEAYLFAAVDSPLAWGLTYAIVWDISPPEYQSLAVDPVLATLLERHRAERLFPHDQNDSFSKILEHSTIARYARVLADARSLAP